MKLLHTAYLLLFMMAFTTVHGQHKQLISGSFSNNSFDEFVASVEAQTTYRFFYNKRSTDSLQVNTVAHDRELHSILEDIFRETDLHFAIANDASVFITRQRPILADLPPGFFDDESERRRTLDFDYSEYEKKGKEMKLAENKVHVIGRNTGDGAGEATIAGTVKDINTGEPLVGVSIFVRNPMIGSTTDQFGYYALTLPKGRHELTIQSIGMKTTLRHIVLYSNGKLDIEMDEDIKPLKEVIVEADADAHVLGMQMGTEKLDIKTMKQIPLALGETDMMKVVLTLPGVQSVGEGTVGLNVRGGSANQNLILLNDAVVYNPSHLFGFFSTFNPDVLKNVDLYKSAIQAEYGGRLSSVLDVRTREGNTRKFSGSGGISPITGRLSIEGPIIKDKTSFILGGRSTYSGWLLRQLDSEQLQNSTASFYDITGNISHKIDDNNNLYISGYGSKDRFTLNNDTAYSYRDQNASIKWKHLFSNKFYGVATIGYSHYNYAVESDENPVEAFTMDADIRQINGKLDFSYFPNSRHTLNAGAHVTRYDLSPGRYRPIGKESQVETNIVADEQGLETALYLSENFEISRNLSVYVGLRYSLYQYLGPHDVFRYAAGLPRRVANITDTVSYGRNKSLATYHGAEPRLSMRYVISKTASIKLSYNRMRQYLHMLSNTVAINPTDIWKLSDVYIKPQTGDQFSFGYYQYLKGNSIEASLETYIKNTDNMTDYKNGAVLLLNHHLETEVVDARGKAYGVEVMIKKLSGKLNGWVSYTYSRSFIQAKGSLSDETVNKGAYYPSNYDKPNAVNVIGNYKFNRRFNFSLNFIYSTGRPITMPIAKYQVDGTTRIHYSDRNQYRIPDYFRTDISINIEGNHKVRKLAHSSWTFAVYNLFGRENPYSVYFASVNGRIQGYKLSIFARPIPTITYNFKF